LRYVTLPSVLFVLLLSRSLYLLQWMLLCSHLPAFFSTATARFSTFLAMLHVGVLATFGTTGFTHFGTQAAHLLCFTAAQAHKLRSGIAYSCTLHV
jgi:hypothetical protein